MMSTLLKLGLSGYDVKPRFGAFQCEYLLQSALFLGKNYGGTRQLCEKNEPTLDHSGGRVHGKTCWLIAYVELYAIRIRHLLHNLMRNPNVCVLIIASNLHIP